MIEACDVQSTVGVVAANPPAAARVGAAALEAGGNAMDAAVAASMACCMLRPNQTGVGGYDTHARQAPRYQQIGVSSTIVEADPAPVPPI